MQRVATKAGAAALSFGAFVRWVACCDVRCSCIAPFALADRCYHCRRAACSSPALQSQLRHEQGTVSMATQMALALQGRGRRKGSRWAWSADGGRLRPELRRLRAR